MKKKSSACLTCPALQQQIEDLQQENKHLQLENKILLQALSNQQRECQTKRQDHASNKRGFTQHFKKWMTPHASKTSPIKDIEMSDGCHLPPFSTPVQTSSHAKEDGTVTNPSFINSTLHGPVSVHINMQKSGP